MKNIALFFGGESVEHDISVITALQIMPAILKRYNVTLVYIRPDGKMVTADNLADANLFLDYQKNVRNEKEVVISSFSQSVLVLKGSKIVGRQSIDVALLCTHGHGGEDGCLQGLFELAKIPYTSCGVASSAICMDKTLSKMVLGSCVIETPVYVHFDMCEYKQEMEKYHKEIKSKIGFPCIVKPARLGSSVGIGICENEESLKEAIELAGLYDEKILVEKFVENAREFCCACIKLSGKILTSKVQEINKGKMFSFEEKYIKDGNKSSSVISQELNERIKRLAEISYKKLLCDSVVRVDFLYQEKSDTLFVNELNTIPGSLSFHMFDTNIEDFVDALLRSAKEKKEGENNIVYKFNSSAIEHFIKINKKINKK